MAIYHFSAQIISRGKGQSAVAAAAYRSGDKLQDERTGEEKFYKREVQPETMILAPKNAPEWVHDRERLWNEVEKIEKNKNSQLSREINIALPVELSKDQQRELIKGFVQEEFVDRGMVADVSIHRDDKSNPHAHIMLTVRQFDEDGTWGNKKRKDYELDQDGNKIPDKNGKPKYTTVSLTDWDKKENLVQWREEWSNHANKALEREGIQERISHLSHEARGLEQLPTVHLGQVINEMEKRGVETERGDINRDRQEYNRLVVDLQKYREEKQAIEQENARKQESPNERLKEIVNDFKEKFIDKVEEEKPVEKTTQDKQQVILNTPKEIAHLEEAKKYLKAEPSFENIQERRQQIDKWEIRKQNGEQFLQWKDKTIREASQSYQAIIDNKVIIQEQRQRLENINWLNPLKMKENRTIKEQAEGFISNSQKEIKKLDTRLNYHREKLDFKTENEFKQIQKEHEIEKPGLLEKNNKITNQISQERDTLKHAVKAIERREVREVAALYPERPEMRYMSRETALQLKELNEKAGKIISPETIQKSRNFNRDKMNELTKDLRFVETEKVRMERTKGYLKDADKYNAIVEKYDKSPVLKGKMLISKSARQEYENAISKRDQSIERMKQDGVSGKGDWNKQNQTFEKSEAKVPFVQSQMKPITRNLGILDAMLQGIEEAGQEAKRQQRQQRSRTKGKFKGMSMDGEQEQGRGR